MAKIVFFLFPSTEGLGVCFFLMPTDPLSSLHWQFNHKILAITILVKPSLVLVFPCSVLVFLCLVLVFPCSVPVFPCSVLVFPCSVLLFPCSVPVFPCSVLVFPCSVPVFPFSVLVFPCSILVFPYLVLVNHFFISKSSAHSLFFILRINNNCNRPTIN